jgi:AcrR family transcriptional regulator
MASPEQQSVPRGRHAPPLEVRLSSQRRRLFAAASAVVAREGYSRTTAEAIAREAGMSKATFYEHFANKEECVLALLDEGATELTLQLTAAADREPGSTYEEHARRNVRAFLRTLAAHPDSARTLLVEIAGAGRAPAARRQAVLEAFAEGLVRDNARHAPATGAPLFASHDDAYAVVGGTVELVARRLGETRPGADLADLEAVIVRLLLGTLDRAVTA